jgi:hypothetical protein
MKISMARGNMYSGEVNAEEIGVFVAFRRESQFYLRQGSGIRWRNARYVLVDTVELSSEDPAKCW